MAFFSRRPLFCFSFLVVLSSLFIISSSAQPQSDTSSKRRLVQRTAPVYPPLARSMALEGAVRLEAIVSPDGTVKTVGVTGGHPVLVQAAISAVRQWRWEQAQHESREPVEVKFFRQ